MIKILTKALFIAGLAMCAVLFSGFSPDRESTDRNESSFSESNSDPQFLNIHVAWVDSIMDTLSLEQRISQLIMVAAYSNNNRGNEKEVTNMVREYKIGGLVFFQGTPYRQAQLTNYYQFLATTPLLIGMDAERGLGMRLDSTMKYPYQMMMGALEDDRLIFDMGVQIAKQMRRLGVHINFAPVVDVNSNPDNPVINNRSFGEDMITVTRKALFYMIGMENTGILSVAKHFPGHGDTNVDSHQDLPVIMHSRQRLDSLELYPFRKMISNGVSGIMVAHLHIPALDDRKSIPSSLSELVVDSLLKKEMGFKGLVFTDALGMKGIAKNLKPVEAAERALLAGNDILLMPEQVPDVIENIAKQVRKGKISQEIIDSRCRKVLAAKYWAGLNHYKPVDLKNLNTDLNKPEYILLKRKLIEQSLTLLQNQGGILPLKRLDTLRVASVVFSDKRDTIFQQSLSLYMPVKMFYLRGDGLENSDSIFRELRKFNLIIASLHSNETSSVRQYGISDCMIELLDSLAARNNVVLDIFANPYLLNRLEHTERFRAILESYENNATVQDISAQAIFGAIGVSGTLPVSVKQWTSTRSGMRMYAADRLKFTIPLEADMDADTLRRIDDIIMNAIEDQAMPGCQVLVARKGKVVLDKAYGTHTYNDNQAVTPRDLYDLASVTKVAATTQAVMRLVDEECIHVDQKLSTYLPYLEKTNKKDLMVRDILLHQAGLLPYIPFYLSTLDPVFKKQAVVSSTASDIYSLKIGPGQYVNRYTQYKNRIISPHYSGDFPYQVAEGMYISRSWPDTMYKGIAASRLNKKKEYVYSDLGFILLKQMVDSITRVPFDELLQSRFYARLGAGRMCFNPLNRFSKDEIAPTEDDQVFRKQLVQGYVHDPRAAMFGGIAGHAGLFSNAEDLAKLMQMLLNKGVYGGDRYLNAETIEMFTKKQSENGLNRRGFGFDKPVPGKDAQSPACSSASPESYGHTGFTGTMIWVDPAYDLVYIFLSNRVYPDASNNRLVEMNVRTNVQQVVYNSLMKK